MYVKVRTIDGKETAHLVVSKLTTIEELRGLVKEKLNVESDMQRLFFKGKQLEDGYKLFDYGVNLNDVIQVMIRQKIEQREEKAEENHEKMKTDNGEVEEDGSSGSDKENQARNSKDEDNDSDDDESGEDCESEYYKVGDKVDCRDPCFGAWFEGVVVRIKKNPKGEILPQRQGLNKDLKDGCIYITKFDAYGEYNYHLLLPDVRPRPHRMATLEELNPGSLILANYNVVNPEERGFWYECQVTSVTNTRTNKELVVTAHAGSDNVAMEGCKIKSWKEVLWVEPTLKRSEGSSIEAPAVSRRPSAPRCNACRDIPGRKCRKCGCKICQGKQDAAKQLLCDECDDPYHIYCLNPPLEEIPDDDEWFCPECKNDAGEIVSAGAKLKESKRRQKMASSTTTSSRNWGTGFACAGRTKVCTIIPPHHFGPIPGVEVGQSWKFRLQASEAGVHRPHVAGMHGTEKDGAYSIVLAGGYEDDADDGDEFTYTGSGGRDLSGNKRTADQSCDQKLTRTNKALALNCNAKLNIKDGAEASNWEGGKPVRVIRNYKFKKHSKYAPDDGNRYDGIYKVVKYWPEEGKSGFLVWRYLLRRDDPHPAPWTKEGKKRINELGLKMIYPDGYLEALGQKGNKGSDSSDEPSPKGKGRGKRTRSSTRASVEETQSPSPKKVKSLTYELEEEIITLTEKDTANIKLWDGCKAAAGEGKQKFLEKVEETFTCICCQEVVCKPVTTTCKHNICRTCLRRSFKAEVFTCPCCRFELGKAYKIEVNEALSKALLNLFPGYDAGR